MASRTIPFNVSETVKARHFFECAWCGVKLTERHHIIQFSNGGEHTVGNLILLCPNCHTQVHNNEINTLELLNRQSTHLKSDRISGGIQFDLTQPNVSLGSAKFINVPVLIQWKDEPLVSLQYKNGEYFLNTRFYDKSGDLIFWMSSNRYWAKSSFTVITKKSELIISNEESSDTFLHIWQYDQTLNIEGKNFINGNVLDFSPDKIQIGNSIFSAFNAANGKIGIRIM